MNYFLSVLLVSLAVSHTYCQGTEKTISVQEYCYFLNSVAHLDANDFYEQRMATESTAIIRSGVPGNYSYTIIPGKEEQFTSYLSWCDVACYINWSTQEEEDFVLLEKDAHGNNPIIGKGRDKKLKSNIISFFLENEVECIPVSLEKRFSWISEMMVPFFLVGGEGSGERDFKMSQELKHPTHVSFNLLEKKEEYGISQISLYEQLKDSILKKISQIRTELSFQQSKENNAPKEAIESIIQKVIDLSYETIEAFKLAGRAVAPEQLRRIKKEPDIKFSKKRKPRIKVAFEVPIQRAEKEKVTRVDREDALVVDSANKALQDLEEAIHVLQTSDEKIAIALYQSQVERARRAAIIAAEKSSNARAEIVPFWERWTLSLKLSEKEQASLALNQVQSEERKITEASRECFDFWQALEKAEPLSNSFEAKKHALNDLLDLISMGFEITDHLITMLLSRAF